MRRAVLALAVLVAAGVFFFGSRAPRDGDRVVDAARAPSSGTPASMNEPLASAAPLPDAAGAVPPKPRSLRGTRVDGGLVTDAAGHFVPTLDARRLFDYFLTATGEAPDEAIRTRVLHEIERRLSAEAAREAATLFERYLVYRERVRTLATVDVPDDGDLEHRLATLVALRREVLGPDAAEAFFAEEEADARRLLAARRVNADTTLAPEERAARVEEIFRAAEAELPDDVRAARSAARTATALRDAEAEIRARGGDAAEIAAMRERVAGPEAAARLGDLDRRRAAWQARVDAFRAARARIADDPTLTAEGRAAAIARLLTESFDPSERLRIEALDRLAADSAALD
jgi:lipase chaperone LimK